MPNSNNGRPVTAGPTVLPEVGPAVTGLPFLLLGIWVYSLLTFYLPEVVVEFPPKSSGWISNEPNLRQ